MQSDAFRYVIASSLSVTEAQQRLEAAILAHKFSVLHTYDLKETLNGKGFAQAAEVRVLELCNASQAFKVLQRDIAINMALPCRINLWQQDGSTMVGMVRPTALLSMLSKAPELGPIAEEVEQAMRAMVDAAR